MGLEVICAAIGEAQARHAEARIRCELGLPPSLHVPIVMPKPPSREADDYSLLWPLLFVALLS